MTTLITTSKKGISAVTIYKRLFNVLILSLILGGSAFAQTSVTAGTTTNGYTLNTAATYVDPAIVVTSSSNITGFKITISSGLKSNDVLAYTGTLPSGVTATAYNSSTGILSFSGSTSGANWQTLLRTVTYVNTNTAQYGNRVITFSAGLSSAFSNGHFYELINSSTMSWTSAKTAAAARSYLGYGGYLATITSAAENTFIKQVLGADAWIGCSDNYLQINAATGTTTYANQTAAEGKWCWVTGPEAGTLFSVGNNSPVTQSGQFAYWSSGEPNNWNGSEDYGEIYSSGIGQWNDLNNSNNLGYVVEYGGLSTDPVQSISSNTTISILISTNTATAPQSLCNGATAAALTGSTPTGGNGTYTYRWLSSTTSATSSFALASGTTTSINYSPGALTVNTWFRREVTSGTLKDTTSAIAITVDAVISATSSKTNVSCNGGTNAAASVVISGGTAAYSYNWTPGNPTGDGTSSVSGLTAGSWTCTTTDALGCTLAISFTITQPSALTASTSQTNISCNGGSNGTASVVASGGTSSYTYSWSPSGGTNTIATGLTAGAFTCIITDANSCTTSKSFTITQPSALAATTSQTNVTCNGASTGSATVSASGGTTAYSYLWSSGGTAATKNSLVAGSYTCTITDANSCTVAKSFTITQPIAISASQSTTNVSCNGLSNGAASVSISGGTSPYNYNWLPGNPTGDGTANVSGLTAGNWTCSIQDANLCPVFTSNFTVTQPSALTSTISKTNVSCNGGSNGTATVSVSGGTASYTYLWVPIGITGSTASGLSVGAYTCIISDANACTISNSTIIFQPTTISATTSQTNISCNGLTDGIAGVNNVTGGTTPYSYSWDFGGTNDVESSLGTGTFTCTITDANSCTLEKNFTITEPTVLSGTLSSTSALCNGGSTGTATVISSGGTSPYTYDWSDGSTSSTATGLAASNYSVTITDDNGCQFNDQVNVSEPSALSLSISKTNSTCSSLGNGIATASPSGGTSPYTYLWSNGETTAAITSLAAGVYIVTVTDDNNCSINSSVTITNLFTLSSSISSTNVSCNGGSNGTALANPSGGTSPYTYVWNGGDVNASISGLSANTYSVIITDNNGCTNANSISITEPNALAATTSSTNANCNGGDDGTVLVTNISGGTVPYSYLWNSGDITASVSGLIAGTYSVTVTDDNGCTLTTNATVGEPSAINTNITTNNVTCFGLTNGDATSTPSGGTSPYTFEWSDSQVTATATTLSAQTYSVTITDDHGCTINETVVIQQPDVISSTYTSTAVSCNGGSDGDATITVIGGTSPYSYSWSTGSTTDSETGLGANTFSVTVTDVNGCTSIESVVVTEPQSLGSTISQTNVTCNGAADGTSTIVVSGGTSPYNYVWTSGSITDVATGLDAQNYSVLIIDDNGCTLTDSVVITEPVILTVTVSGVNTLCNGNNNGSASVVANGGTTPYTYTWSSGGTADVESNLSAGTYTVTITDDNGCSTEELVTIAEPAVLQLATSTTDANCGQANGTGGVLVTGGTSAYTYNWSTGGNADVENNLAAGNYSVTVTDANGCSETNSVSVSNIGAPTVSVAQTSVLCYGDNNGTIDLTVTGGTGAYTYTWSNGDTTASLSGLAPITYSYVVADSANCQSTGVVTIVEPDVISITSTTVNETISNDGSIDVTVTGGVIPYTFSWSDGSSTEDLSNLASGNYTITVTDAYGCIHIETITVGSSVGLNHYDNNSSFNVYPNPNNGKFYIVGKSGVMLALQNSLGQTIKHIQLNTDNHYAVSIDNLSTGVYFIQNEMSKTRTMKKIVVIK